MKHCTNAQGQRIAYVRSGDSRDIPMVLLPGFCEDHTVWQPLLSSLQHLPLLRLDLPGFGQSDRAAQADMAHYAAAVVTALDAENIEKCVLVGHSMGGYAALELAARWPERLAGLGLFHSHPFEDTEEKKQGRQRGIETLQAGKRDLYVAQLFPGLFAPDYAKAHPEVINTLIVKGKEQSAEGIADALKAMIGRRDHQKTLSEAKCPVLFLLGQHDTLVPPDQGMKAAMLPEVAQTHLLPEAAHMAMYESSKESAEILNSFWDFCRS